MHIFIRIVASTNKLMYAIMLKNQYPENIAQAKYNTFKVYFKVLNCCFVICYEPASFDTVFDICIKS